MSIRKEDVKQEVFDLYDDYAHSRLNRRDFMEKLSAYAVGGLTVTALMSFLMPDYKNTLQVKADDPRLKTEYVNYNSPKGGGSIKALLARPENAGKKLGGVVVIHENRGLNPYIEDVCRRAALAGFIAIAPDALTPLGGYPGNDDKGREMQSKRDKNEMLEDFIAAYDYLKASPECNGRILLRRWDRQHDGRPDPGPRSSRPLLWRPASRRARAPDKGAPPDPLRGPRYPRQRRLARI